MKKIILKLQPLNNIQDSDMVSEHYTDADTNTDTDTDADTNIDSVSLILTSNCKNKRLDKKFKHICDMIKNTCKSENSNYLFNNENKSSKDYIKNIDDINFNNLQDYDILLQTKINSNNNILYDGTLDSNNLNIFGGNIRSGSDHYLSDCSSEQLGGNIRSGSDHYLSDCSSEQLGGNIRAGSDHYLSDCSSEQLGGNIRSGSDHYLSDCSSEQLGGNIDYYLFN